MTSSRSRWAVLTALTLAVSACSGTAATPVATTGPASAAPSVAPSVAAATPDPFVAQWDALVVAAKAEGEVVVASGPEGAQADGPWFDQFTKQYGIKVTIIGGQTADITSRITAERAQGVYSIDIGSLGGSGQNNFVKMNAFDPLDPFLIEPSVLDRSQGYRADHALWADTTQKFCQFIGLESEPNLMELYYNKDKVSQAELDSIQSWQDLVTPAWKGRIVVGDISTGADSTHVTYGWLALGQDWFAKLLANDPAVVISGDERSFADGLAQGKWSIGMLPPGTASLESAISSGLPLALFPRTLAEGPLHTGGGRVCVSNQAPHPNAAKLLANWMLDKDGQTAFNAFTQRVGRVAIRSDVPQGNIPSAVWERANAKGELIDQSSKDWKTAQDAAQAFIKAKFAELKLVPGS